MTLSVNAVVVQTTSLGSVNLVAFPSQSVPSAIGIYFQMPTYVAVPGDTVTVDMWAQTGGSNDLESWGVSLVYDTSSLAFHGIVYPLYTTVLSSMAVFNALNVTGSGGTGAITGWFVAATLSFDVLPASAGSTVQLSAPAILTNVMLNSVPITYRNNFAAAFADFRGGWAYSTGQLSVSSPVVAGIYAYSSRSSFVNTFELNGILSTDSMTVMATFDTGRMYPSYQDVAVHPSSCVSANSGVMAASAISTGCSIAVQSGGSSSVDITAAYSGVNTTVAYRSYYFINFVLKSTRAILRRLGCDFETTYLTAFAALTLDGITPLQVVDVSNIVTFISSDPSVVSVSGRIAKGLSVGAATLKYGSGLASFVISVSSSVASVSQLVSYTYSSAVVSPVSLSTLELGATPVFVLPMLSLTAELQAAAVVTYAQNDDGVWTDVSQYPTLTLTSSDPANLAVSKPSLHWQASVPSGASSISDGIPVIQGVLTDSCSATLTSSGYGYVSSNLSVPIAISVTATVNSLARPGTPAAATLGITTSTQLTVTLTYRSVTGILSYRDFTADPRTVFSASFVRASGAVSSSGFLSLIPNSDIGTAGSVTIDVTLPSYAAAATLSGSLTIAVVDVNTAVALQGSLVHAMTPSVPVTASTPLARIGCSNLYQSGLLSVVIVTLTDGSTRTGTPALMSSNAAVATVNGTTVNALTQGISTITATYATAVGSFTAWINSATTSITSITLSFPSSTLSGQTGTSAAAAVAVSFSDGTFFLNAVTSFSPLSALLSFSSSDPTAVTFTASAVATLIHNSWQFATLTAASQCGDGHSSTFSMAGNLAPISYDSKLGSITGLTFPPASFGQTVDASINVQIASSPLATYQVALLSATLLGRFFRI